MTQQAPTGYAPLVGATMAANVATRTALSALVMPNPIDGMMFFCAEAGVQSLYAFSLNSGAVVDGTNVLATTAGGASRWLKVAMGTAGGGPGGVNTDVQFNDAGAFGGAVSATYDKVSGFLTLLAGVNVGAGPYALAGEIRMTDGTSIRYPGGVNALTQAGGTLQLGAAGIINNIIKTDAGGFILLRPGANDKLALSATGAGGWGAGFFSNAPSFGGGQDVIFIANAALIPPGNPVGGFLVYVDPGTGNLVAKGAAGTVTVLAVS